MTDDEELFGDDFGSGEEWYSGDGDEVPALPDPDSPTTIPTMDPQSYDESSSFVVEGREDVTPAWGNVDNRQNQATTEEYGGFTETTTSSTSTTKKTTT